MGKIKFTNREIKRAWRNNYQAYKQVKVEKNNAHRLMLFYAVECGLKAIIMERKNKDITDSSIAEFGHNINKMLDKLHTDKTLKLPNEIRLKSLKKEEQRVCEVGDINQIWRYGHSFNNTQQLNENDRTLEEKLVKISVWIKEELSGI